MRNSKKGVLVAGLTLALFVPVLSSFGQLKRQLSGAPQPPKAITPPTVPWAAKNVAYVKASNTSKDDMYGGAVAVSGDGNTVAVGAVGEDSAAKSVNAVSKAKSVNSGAVYVYTRDAKGWKQQAYLKASNTTEGAQFGGALSLSYDGNLLAVGATGEGSSAMGVNGNQADNSMPGAGAVYLFARTGATWAQQAYVKSSNTGGPDVGYQFGFALALSSDGSTLAVGETSDPSAATGINGNAKNIAAPDSGAVFVFAKNGDTWAQQAYVKPWNTVNRGALFGYAVSLSAHGDDLAVGAYDENGGRGAAYVFGRKNGKWTQLTRLNASNAEAGDSLGCAISISDDGNTILAGAFDEDAVLAGIQPPDAGEGDEQNDVSVGAAYVFVRKDGKWSQQAYVKAMNARENDQFAWALAMSRDGNTIAIGSHLEDGGATGINGDQKDASAEYAGAAYVYIRTGDKWNPAAYLKASNTRPGAEFGIAMAINGDGTVMASGSPKENSAAKGVNGKQADTSATNAGAAYIYY